MGDDDIPGDLLGLQKPSENAPETAPESRLKDADDLRKIGARLIKDDEQRSIQRALVRGNIDGNPPFPPKTVGAKWEANVNFMAGKARVNRALSTYSALFAGVENYADIQTGYQPGNPERVRWNETLSTEFHWLEKTWSKGFDWNMQHRIKQMITEGFGPVLMEQGDNWRFRALDSSCIKVPQGTSSCLDERCKYVLLLDKMSVVELWEKIQNHLSDKEEQTPRGWNKAAVKWAIRNVKSAREATIDSWETWQQRLQQHDLLTGTENDSVNVFHLFVREFPKGGEKQISHFIATQTDLSAPLPIEKDFLFRHVRCYESYEQCLHVFFSNIGDGTWHTVKGLAFDSFKHDVMYNRMMCRLADRAFVDSTAMVASPTQNNSDKLDNVTFGTAIVRLPAGAQIVQSGFAGNLNGVMDAIRLVTNSVNGNTGASNPRTIMREDGKGEMPTLGQVRAQIQQDTQLSNDQIRLDYLAMDRLYTEQVRRACRKNTSDKEAKEFQRRCMAKGVPREALDDIESVTANRMSGYGSAAMKDAVVQQLSTLVPMFNETGKNNFVNFAIMAATENPGLVEYFNPPQQQVTQDDELIVIENGLLKQGIAPVLVSGQIHVNHLQGHIAFLDSETEGLEQAIDDDQPIDPAMLDEKANLVALGSQHMEEHFAQIENDPSRRHLVKGFRLKISDYTAFHGKLRQAVKGAVRDAQIAEEDQQNAMALGIKDQADLNSQQLHDQIALDKAQTQKAIKLSNAQTGARIKLFQARQQNARDNLKTFAEIGRDRLKATNGASRE